MKSGIVSMVITFTPIHWLKNQCLTLKELLFILLLPPNPGVMGKSAASAPIQFCLLLKFNVEGLLFLLLSPPSPRYLARHIREEIKEWRANKEMDKWDMLLPDYERTRKVDQLERCIRHWESALNHNPPLDSYAEVITKWTIKYLKELLKGVGDKWEIQK
ncbi:hypothetical protein ES703_111872 [subsurface metagenome]